MKRFFSLFLFLLVLFIAPQEVSAQQQFSVVQQVNNTTLPQQGTTRTVNTPIATAGTPNATTLTPQILTGGDVTMNANPSFVTQTVALVFVSLLPYLIILLTAFIKIVVVLSLLRNAIGVQQSPPNQVINGLALILSIYVMYPTVLLMYNNTEGLIRSRGAQTELLSKESAALLIDVINVAKEPMRDFLVRNTTSKQLKGFYTLANKVIPEPARTEMKPTDFLILVPAYITSQLKDAYEIGVLIYLPFFVIDLVTSNILLAMGMMMLSPLTIALPLKLLLLVMLDGWTLLIQGLVLSFK